MKSIEVMNHLATGKFVHVDGTNAFVYDQGSGEPVVCFHGVPASSYLYRNIVTGLAIKGFRGIAFDLLGTGLSERPENFDYTWTNLGKWSLKLIDNLRLKKFHIVLHDIGAPIGCEVIAKIPDRILSVTIMNAPLANLHRFKKPFPMFLYEKKGVGELLANSSNAIGFKKLMHLKGVVDRDKIGFNEARAYAKFLRGNNQGRSFIKIMRGFETTMKKEVLYINALKNLNVPKQIIWGTEDRGLTIEENAEPLRNALGLEKIIKLNGKHFLQEDRYVEITELISMLAKT
ncbi:alpha/beta hydrolase [Ulvibacterium sp.]|uniref:alpha/beta fold hydrolase n=1 Tax=Ulvibacterium sp. TaxID=2665914 RepID=UPI00262052C7|nr:alpha/beta hydrolase [Ulvibacterium sp.]